MIHKMKNLHVTIVANDFEIAPMMNASSDDNVFVLRFKSKIVFNFSNTPYVIAGLTHNTNDAPNPLHNP